MTLFFHLILYIEEKTMKTEHILVIRFSAMGDVAMTVPVIQSLAKQYPKVRILCSVVPLPVLSLKT